MDLFTRTYDANPQAVAVLAYLQDLGSGLEASWSTEERRYLAEPKVFPWSNCREQGYVVTMYDRARDSMLSIAWFEHRNSDSICAVEFTGNFFLNPPTIDDIPEDHPYSKSKHDVTFQVGFGRASEMATWIFKRLEKHWNGE